MAHAESNTIPRSGHGGLELQIVRGPVNWRSVLLGLLGVVFICGLTPFNNHVLANTSLVGSYLPIGLLLFVALFMVLINAPLVRWAPRQAMQSQELAVALSMTLVACAIPGFGLMQFLPAQLIGIHIHAGQDAEVARLLNDLDLPRWMFPTIESDDFRQRAMDPVVRDYIGRTLVDDDSFIPRWNAVPWSAWVTPAITWGLLLICVWGAVLFLCIIVRRQWIENERLAFPLATVYLSLIEPTRPGGTPGSWLLSSRPFWIAFGGTVVIQLLRGLHAYFPMIPAVSLSADMEPVLGDTILSHSELLSSPLRLQFIVIGVMYFVQSRIALSLWIFFLLQQFMMIAYWAQGSILDNAVRTEQQFGSLVVYGLLIAWIGRQHWMLVARQMCRGAQRDEPRDKFLPYACAGWGLALSLVGICIWLVCAGTTALGAVVIVMMLVLLFMVMARIIAETGLVIGEIPVPIWRAWVYLAHEVPSVLSVRTTLKTSLFSSLFTGLFTWDMREPLSVYGTHAVKVADAAAYPSDRPKWVRGWLFVGALGLSLVVGYVVAGTSMLYSEYSYGSTLDSAQAMPLNAHATLDASRDWVIDSTMAFAPPRDGHASPPYNRAGHFTFGALVTAICGYLRIRFVNWPLHPAGFLVANTGPMRLAWFSVFIGWMLKAVLVKWGGSRLYLAARPVFIGLILGEVAITCLWLVVSLVLTAIGIPYRVIPPA